MQWARRPCHVMGILKFKHVLNGLLILSAICAFVIPARVSDAVRGNLAVLFVPVSWPTKTLANAILGKTEKIVDEGSPNPEKPRPDNELLTENLQLKTLVSNLS